MEKLNLLFNSPSNWTMFGESYLTRARKRDVPNACRARQREKNHVLWRTRKAFQYGICIANQVRCGMHHRHAL